RRRLVSLAPRRAGRAGKADMEVIVMPPEGPHLGEPGTISPDRIAELFLDARMDQHPLDTGIACGAAQHSLMRPGPALFVDIKGIRLQHGDGADCFALVDAHPAG